MKASNEELLSCALLFELLGCALSFGGEEEFNYLKDLAARASCVSELKTALAPLLASDYAAYAAERNAVFYDFSLANVPMDASFYDEGRDNGKMRVIASGIYARAGIAKSPNSSENEDTFNLLFAAASVIASKASEENLHAKESYEELLAELFERVMNPVIDEFAQKLAEHKNSHIFAALAQLLELLIELCREIFAIAKPPKKDHSAADAALAKVPFQPRVPTNFSKVNMEEVTAFKGM